MRWEISQLVEITGKTCMILLLGLCGETTDSMIEAVKRVPRENVACKGKSVMMYEDSFFS